MIQYYVIGGLVFGYCFFMLQAYVLYIVQHFIEFNEDLILAPEAMRITGEKNWEFRLTEVYFGDSLAAWLVYYEDVLLFIEIGPVKLVFPFLWYVLQITVMWFVQSNSQIFIIIFNTLYPLFEVIRLSLHPFDLFSTWLHVICLAILAIWARGVGPRFRPDQLSQLTWSDLIAFLFSCFFASSLVVTLVPIRNVKNVKCLRIMTSRLWTSLFNVSSYSNNLNFFVNLIKIHTLFYFFMTQKHKKKLIEINPIKNKMFFSSTLCTNNRVVIICSIYMRLDLFALLSLILKHANIQFFTTTPYNQWIVINSRSWPALVNLIRFHSLFFSSIPITCTAINKNTQHQCNTVINLVYVFVNLSWNLKLHFVITNQDTYNCFDVSNLFNGLSWPMRETSEMFNLHFVNKVDSRRLLLEYTSENSPMLKTFACEGYEELEYDARERWLIYKPIKLRDEINF